MKFEEILEETKKLYSESVSDFAYDESNTIPNVGNFKEIDQHGGEGEGERWWSVKHFVDHNVYIKVKGFYSSYNGVDFFDGWDCCEEVTPKEKTIIVYE